MKGKAPAFQFYPADWLNDIKLQSCSLAAQGLLVNLMCLMHQSEKYGFLLINGRIPLPKEVSHLLRLHHKTYQARLIELILNGVLYEDENKAIYCKRMVKDEHIRQVRREAGKLGGNPLLKQEDNQELKQKSTPSSSSSSSSSPSEPIKEPTSVGSSAERPEDIILSIPLVDKTEYHVMQFDIDQWQESYPGVDVELTLRGIRQWNIDNPVKR